MSLFFIIVAAILTAVYLARTPGALRNLVIGFSIPFILLIIIGILGHS